MTIHLEGVRKAYPSGYVAVHGLDLQIAQGEFFTLLGPSGCGKTTTLRMIAGLETASAGRIFIGGRDRTYAHPRDRDVAMVFQSYALYPHMTVRQNLALNLQVRKTPSADIDQRITEVSRTLGIEGLLERKPKELSGGQRQRVALGRALVRRPNVFLMDEPLSNLDLKLRERTRTELKTLHERLAVTTVYVTHDQAEALTLSSRIGIMDAGRLQQVGTPQEIYDCPSSVFVAKFVGTPSINIVPVRASIADDHVDLVLEGTNRSLPGTRLPAAADLRASLSHGMDLVLGLRPESVALLPAPAPMALPGRISLIEPMGSVNHAFVNLDGVPRMTFDDEPLVAVVRSNERLEQGAPVWMSVSPERLVLFERQTGRAVAMSRTDGRWSPAP